MRVAEEPFVTRASLLSMLRPGEATSERPFRTLREHGGASAGFAVTMRSPSGQILGRAQFYSALNTDAARAFRLQHVELAQALARRAQELEESPAAQRLRQAIAVVAGGLSTSPMVDGPIGLRRYLDLRRRSMWSGLDSAGLTREWLASSEAWLESSDQREEIVAAIVELDRAACEARTDLVANELPMITTFFGLVRRMDPVSVEVEGETETVLVPRDDLERQGLAVIDQPVALLREVLPGRGSYLLPMSAVSLEQPAQDLAQSPWAIAHMADGGIPAGRIADSDHAWLHRELAREPTAVPVAPLLLR